MAMRRLGETVPLIGTREYLVDDLTARAPSYYRAYATAEAPTVRSKFTAPRATIGAKGSGVTAEVIVTAYYDNTKPIVMKATGDDGVESKRKSTSESTWGAWAKSFDEDSKPAIATDVTGAGTAAQQNPGTTGGNVPLLSGNNTWTGTQTFADGIVVQTAKTARFAGPMVLSSGGNATIAAGVLTLPVSHTVSVSGEGAASDDLVTIATNATDGIEVPSGTIIFVFPVGEAITVKHNTGNIRCGADFTLNANSADLMVLRKAGTKWVCASKQTNGTL